METITQCPHSIITPDIHSLIKMIDWADAGHLPCGGGVLDNAKSFLDAMDVYERAKARINNG